MHGRVAGRGRQRLYQSPHKHAPLPADVGVNLVSCCGFERDHDAPVATRITKLGEGLVPVTQGGSQFT